MDQFTNRPEGEPGSRDPGRDRPSGGDPGTPEGRPDGGEPGGAAESERAPAPAPLWTRAWKVFVSPGEVFRGLAAHPAAVGAMILGAVLMALSNLAIPTEVFEEGLRTTMMETGQDMPGDPAMVARITKIGSVFGLLIVWPVIIAVSAGIYALVLLFGLGFRGTYRQYLAVTAHALLIPAVGALLLAPLKVMTQDPAFSLSVGSLAFFLEEGFVARFLGYLDLFSLWSYVLVGIGAAAIDGARSTKVAVSATVGVAVLVSLVIASFTG